MIQPQPQQPRNRNYSGHSTSPDRDGSPDRGYNRQPRAPPRSYMQQRSPSTSPTRPPRSRSSPTRESVVRRVSSRRGNEAAANGLRDRSRESNNGETLIIFFMKKNAQWAKCPPFWARKFKNV